MKQLIIIFLLFFNLVTFGQTKKETIDWLNSKFEKVPFITTSLSRSTNFLKINDDGSFIITSYDYYLSEASPNQKNYQMKTVFTGHFKNLSPNSIRTSNINGNIYFYASCSSGKCIKEEHLGKTDFSTYYNADVLLGVTYEPSLESRCKKAFIHLIELYGGKNEAF